MAGPNGAPTSEKSWPVFGSLRGYRIAHLPGDLIAGLTLAAIAIPE
jgi:sulfate permease, SulP family